MSISRRNPVLPILVLCIAVLLLVIGSSWLSGTNVNAQQDKDSFDVEQRLRDLGIELHDSATPVANYVNAVSVGNLVFLAGHGPLISEGNYITGKVGSDISLEEGREAARLTTIDILSTLKAEIGDLNKVKRIVKVLGLVNCDPSFTDQPKVMNGFSDLIVSVFGESRGKHARSAVGVASLYADISVEIEMIVELKEE